VKDIKKFKNTLLRINRGIHNYIKKENIDSEIKDMSSFIEEVNRNPHRDYIEIKKISGKFSGNSGKKIRKVLDNFASNIDNNVQLNLARNLAKLSISEEKKKIEFLNKLNAQLPDSSELKKENSTLLLKYKSFINRLENTYNQKKGDINKLISIIMLNYDMNPFKDSDIKVNHIKRPVSQDILEKHEKLTQNEIKKREKDIDIDLNGPHMLDPSL